MDASRFDALVRAFATGGTRRRLLRLVAALPFGGALLAGEDAAGADRPHERLGRRTKQRNHKQRAERRRDMHEHNHDKNNNGNNKHDNDGGGRGRGCNAK